MTRAAAEAPLLLTTLPLPCLFPDTPEAPGVAEGIVEGSLREFSIGSLNEARREKDRGSTLFF